MFFLLICRILVFCTRNPPPKHMMSSMEGAVAIWRPDQCYQPLSDAIMHVEESCVIWCFYFRLYLHSTQPGGVMCHPPPHFFRNRLNPAMDSQSRSKWLGTWSRRRTLFSGKCCEGSPIFRACFRQQQVYYCIDGSGADDVPARSNRSVG